MNKICGIYKITSPSGKIYIGQSVDIKHRINTYKNLCCKRQPKLYNSIVKYGWNIHRFDILIECDVHELNYLEKYYIAYYNSFDTVHGLNLTSGGDTAKMSEETKRKIGESSKGNTKWVGRNHSEESKLKMSISRKGRKASDETKLKMSILRKGRKAWNKGICHTKETKEKMRVSAHKLHSKEHVRNQANARKLNKLH